MYMLSLRYGENQNGGGINKLQSFKHTVKHELDINSILVKVKTSPLNNCNFLLVITEIFLKFNMHIICIVSKTCNLVDSFSSISKIMEFCFFY